MKYLPQKDTVKRQSQDTNTGSFIPDSACKPAHPQDSAYLAYILCEASFTFPRWI